MKNDRIRNNGNIRNTSLQRELRALYVEDVMEILGIKESKAYQIMRRINKELEAEGYETIAGRVSEARFREKFYCGKVPVLKTVGTTGKPRRTIPASVNL